MMPRNLRVHYPGAVYHVICRGVDRRSIYTRDEDRHTFLHQMRAAFREHDIPLYAYCLMGNHFHLLLSVSQTPLGVPMQKFLTSYAIYFNRNNGRVGHLFEDRYKSIECRNDAYLIQLTAYIHMNPVRAGLAVSPDKWRWSSHHEFTGGAGDMLQLERLKTSVGMDASHLREAYLDRLTTEPDIAEEVTLTDLIARCASASGVDIRDFVAGERGTGYTRARRMLAQLAPKYGYTLAEAARAVNCTRTALAQLLSVKNVS